MEERALGVESKALDGVWALSERTGNCKADQRLASEPRKEAVVSAPQPATASERAGCGQAAGHRADFTSSPAACSSLCPQRAELITPVRRAPRTRPTRCHSAPWRPHGDSPPCHGMRPSPFCISDCAVLRREEGSERAVWARAGPTLQCTPWPPYGEQTGTELRVVQKKEPQKGWKSEDPDSTCGTLGVCLSLSGQQRSGGGHLRKRTSPPNSKIVVCLTLSCLRAKWPQGGAAATAMKEAGAHRNWPHLPS